MQLSTNAASTGRRIITTSVYSPSNAEAGLGNDCYSYFFVQRAFLPLLERWGQVVEVPANEADLQAAIVQARMQGLAPLHVSFLPPQYMPLAAGAPNICVPFWEYPDIPAHDIDGDPRRNWRRTANKFTSLIAACEFTRSAFLRAGATNPIHLVPAPLAPERFNTVPWHPRQQSTLAISHYDLSSDAFVTPVPASQLVPSVAPAPAASMAPDRGIYSRLRGVYRRTLKPLVPGGLRGAFAKAAHDALTSGPVAPVIEPPPIAPHSPLSLSGVVYASIFNPFDERKNWRDLLTAFVRAIGDRADATLVFKLAVSRSLVGRAVREMHEAYREASFDRRARVLLVADYLSDQQMHDLTGASTYYVNASRAEGACLPLQDALAASRPGIAPTHSALGEYFDGEIGFEVRSGREPTHFSWDRSRRLTTTWARIDWESLCAAFVESYRLARERPREYAAMSKRARDRMLSYAHPQAVWPALRAALDGAAALSKAA